MSSIDERIVRAKFDNADFERGVRQTLSSLAQLQKGMKLEGASKGLDDIGRAAGRFNLGNIGSSVENISSKFTAMGAIAIGALATIGSKAVSVAAQLANSFTGAPIVDGLKEYETNLNSIQTILANTGLEGQAGLNKVNGALQALNTVLRPDDLQLLRDGSQHRYLHRGRRQARRRYRGHQGYREPRSPFRFECRAGLHGHVPAVAGSRHPARSSSMDWNSVVNAGMGGKVFQNALIETAKNQGIAIDGIIKKNGSFRDSLQEGWLTDKVLTETLNKLTGDLTDSQLKAMGYTEKQIVGIQKTRQDSQGRRNRRQDGIAAHRNAPGGPRVWLGTDVPDHLGRLRAGQVSLHRHQQCVRWRHPAVGCRLETRFWVTGPRPEAAMP
jgi:hypothetical protein